MKTLFTLLLVMAATLADARQTVRLQVFECGRYHFDDVSLFGLSNAETPTRDLFVPCYLISHPQGLMIWDAGLPDEIAGKGTITIQEGATMRLDVSLKDQLAELSLRPADIDLVAFSHSHSDHVGAANLFTNARLLIQATEYAYAFEGDDNPMLERHLYMGLENNARTLLTGNHDVFGDGSVILVAAPGHTPGHQVLLLRLENTGTLVLSGDLYHFAESRSMRRVPHFNFDAQQTLDSMAKIEALIRQEGATLWIGHELELAESLELAPAYYD